MKVHIYSGQFDAEDKAVAYATEMDYEDDDSIPALYENIGATWLDEDFIETICGPDRFEYLSNLLVVKDQIDQFKSKCPIEHNTLFLIFAVKDTSNENFKPINSDYPIYIGSPNARFHHT